MITKLKYKVGDQVKVVDNTGCHGFDIGEEGEVIRLCQNDVDPHYEIRGDLGSWFLNDEECEKIL